MLFSHVPLSWFDCGGSDVVDSLLIVAPIIFWWLCVWSLFRYAEISVSSSFAIILIGKRERWVLTLNVFLMSCTISVLWLFLAMRCVGL